MSPSLVNLTALLQLIFFPGRVIGQILDILGNIHKIEFLAISKNSLSGPIQWSLNNLYSVHTLDLSYNQLQVSIPTGLTMNANLKILVFAHNDIMGELRPGNSQAATVRDSPQSAFPTSPLTVWNRESVRFVVRPP